MLLSDPLALAALALLHVLVLVYWLGGDLGAFVASHILSDEAAHPQARLAAAKVVAEVDMAPRTALILALPTGLTLLGAKGLGAVPVWGLGLIWIGGAFWLALVWWLHRRHPGPRSAFHQLDLALRWLLFGALVAIASGMVLDWPLFVRLKCAALAATVLCGLLIRARLAPFGPALAGLAKGLPTEEDNAAIRKALGAARPLVILIWILLGLAALLGLWRPL
jgi:hypothetical protein